ncbi:DUF1737 domain-containing protein [Ekhidna sp.]|uniref:DUF1737 domain-containing protein n=1 Tax=Ekhidna sp. TaxID=2608089 RepID=UPI00329713F4
MEKHYMIATGKNVKELTDEVQFRIDEGWTLQGGISITLATSPVFAQALIKEAK